MLVTPDEAAGRWCPFTRVHNADGASNRVWPGYPDSPFRPPYGTACVGRDCMAWRQGGITTGRGYCGLAGAPTP